MKRSKANKWLSVLAVSTLLVATWTAVYAESIVFNSDVCIRETLTFGSLSIKYRACKDIVYVKNPVDTAYQKMNVYIPEAYFKGREINGFTAKTAPIFMPNQVGGYNPGEPATVDKESVQYALSKGYVVAAPGARGKTQDYGRAPAGIVDLKAAVRYLRYNDKLMPGDAEKIISNGTSAGGAMSSLLGATGNNKDYKPYLKEIGAAYARDDIFAASCYCPITNLNNADMAYEWLFNGENIWHWFMGPTELTEAQRVLSDLLKAMFPAYLNRLKLKANGTLLELDEYGEGNFNDYAKSFVIESAQKALDKGTDFTGPEFDWMTIEAGKITDIDLAGYAAYVTRMKPVPAFDNVDLSAGGTWENILFGVVEEGYPSKHFTRFSFERSIDGDPIADKQIVKMMSPMDYIGTEGSTATKNWRIRHGAADRDTSIAIPIILTTKLRNAGFDVDFAMPWGQGHGGDYDLDELFAWIDKISKVCSHCGGHHDYWGFHWNQWGYHHK